MKSAVFDSMCMVCPIFFFSSFRSHEDVQTIWVTNLIIQVVGSDFDVRPLPNRKLTKGTYMPFLFRNFWSIKGSIS